MAKRNGQGATFGDWLLVQVGRPGTIGDSAAVTKSDPKLPRRGSPDGVRKRLTEIKADESMHAMVGG